MYWAFIPNTIILLYYHTIADSLRLDNRTPPRRHPLYILISGSWQNQEFLAIAIIKLDFKIEKMLTVLLRQQTKRNVNLVPDNCIFIILDFGPTSKLLNADGQLLMTPNKQ